MEVYTRLKLKPVYHRHTNEENDLDRYNRSLHNGDFRYKVIVKKIKGSEAKILDKGRLLDRVERTGFFTDFGESKDEKFNFISDARSPEELRALFEAYWLVYLKRDGVLIPIWPGPTKKFLICPHFNGHFKQLF
ncbi:hypothetical protein [Hydromonas duriensis]|uniref:Uncharacterized protein n=1 Tax=Hydromonas duriensis TaxID=1527608 RepID=A0A4R6Y1V4_9BURK|nr:hypothetical protein [Hydromonas duriensis]TDR25018.1 hypothetical protein DFR44_1712 [Hydromonas duriensis]